MKFKVTCDMRILSPESKWERIVILAVGRFFVESTCYVAK